MRTLLLLLVAAVLSAQERVGPPQLYANQETQPGAGVLWAGEKLPTEKAGIAHYAFADDGTILPDPDATPGEVLTTDATIVCVSGYAKKARKQVKTSTLKEAVAGYGVKWQPKLEEADHLISIELGGAPASILNLWPQPREKRITKGMGAESKDRLENELHRLACNGDITLGEAQQEIRTNWVESYRLRFHQ